MKPIGPELTQKTYEWIVVERLGLIGKALKSAMLRSHGGTQSVLFDAGEHILLGLGRQLR